jgi:hypothetical protein
MVVAVEAVTMTAGMAIEVTNEATAAATKGVEV